jgi:uncharacterized oxidoreductase
MRVFQYCTAIEQGELDPLADPVILRDNPAGAVLDGRCAFGQVASMSAMNLAIEKAGKTSVAAVTLRNSYHSGRLGAYAQLAADAGMIGIVMVNAGGGGQSVAPFGGIDRRLATNPLAIAAPSSGAFDPVLDIATSMAPEGKVRDYLRRGALLPEGWLTDAHGRPSRDPADLYANDPGALLPCGGSAGHKGFGLGFMVDILAGALSGAGVCGPERTPASDGVLFIAIDVGQFVSAPIFNERVEKLVGYVKTSRPQPGVSEIFAPGELEAREMDARKRLGVPLDDVTWRELESLAERYGVDVRPAENGAPSMRLAPAPAASLAGGDLAAS